MTVKLGFVIIAHDHPANAARLARVLLESGSSVCIHFDLKAGQHAVAAVKEHLGHLAEKLVWAQRVNVAWGEWSIVQATLNGVRALFESGADPDYIHLMSASDYPIRPVSEFAAFLARHRGTDFIESYGIEKSDWVKGGLSKERYLYRHFFNFKKRPKLFHLNWRLQAALKLRKKVPSGLHMHMGSQWCTLTGQSWKTVLARAEDPKIISFFRRSWIPDEMFVQTMLANAGTARSNRHLTLYQFSDYGVPIVFYDSHLDYLRRQPFFFVRKLSPHAAKLRDGLDEVITGQVPPKAFPDYQIGTATNEYETFRALYRTGIKGSRTPGYVKDPYFGDLEWNRRPYVAIFGANSEELNMVASAIGTIPGLICHGFLFGKTIGFAGGRERFAGYSKWDTALRDNKPTTFLVDVISQSRSLTTCFLVNSADEFKFFDHLRWDPNAHLIHLDGGLIGGFLERNAAFNIEEGLAGKVDAQGRTIVQHLTNFFDAQRTLFTARRKILAESHAKFAWIDVLSAEWRHDLRDILGELSHEFTVRTAMGSGSPAVARRQRLDLPGDLLLEVLAAAQSREDEKRILREVMAQPKQAYLVLLGTSRTAAAGLAAVLAESQLFRCDADRPASLASAVVRLVDAHLDDNGLPRILSFGLDEAPGIDIFFNDPDARIVFLTGPAGEAAAEMLGAGSDGAAQWCNPVTYQHVLSETSAVIASVKSRISGAVCPVLELDIREAGADAALALFLSGTFHSLDAELGMLLQRFKAHFSAGKAETLPDAASSFSNGRYLAMIDRLSPHRAARAMAPVQRFQAGEVARRPKPDPEE